MDNDLTVIIPALNEELHIRAAVNETLDAFCGLIDDYEIIVFNDGSTDRTGEIADELAALNDRISVVHHDRPMGLGYSYKEGVRLAAKAHVLLVPGDNELRGDSLRQICSRTGEHDIVATYFLNPEVRPWIRQTISKVFSWLIRSTSGVNLTYFNGPTIHRTRLVRREVASDGFTYQAELLVRLVQSGATHEEIGMYINSRPTTSAFRFGNVIDVFKGTTRLMARIVFSRADFNIDVAEPALAKPSTRKTQMVS